MLDSRSLRLFANPRVARALPYRGEGREKILSLAAFAQAKGEITSWPGYQLMPLRRLAKLAAAAGIGEILYKDEGERFGIGSFKALGGAYAVLRVLQRHIRERGHGAVSSHELASGRCRGLTSQVTVTCATDGNHGRSVAWGAGLFAMLAMLARLAFG